MIFLFVFDCSFLSLFCDKKRKKRNQRSLLLNHHKNIYLKKIRDAIFHKIKNFGKRRQYKRTLSKQTLSFYFPNFLFASLTDNFVHKNKELVTELVSLLSFCAFKIYIINIINTILPIVQNQ